jgi:hypothetical protein
MHFLVDKIYNEINEKIIQLKKPNSDYQVNIFLMKYLEKFTKKLVLVQENMKIKQQKKLLRSQE